MSFWLAAWNFENSFTVFSFRLFFFFSFSFETGFFLPPRLWSSHQHLGESVSPAPRSNKSDTQDNRPGIQAHKRLSILQEALFPSHRQYRDCPSRSLGGVALSALFPHCEVVSSVSAYPYQVFQLLLQIWQEVGVWKTQRTGLWTLPEQAHSGKWEWVPA